MPLDRPQALAVAPDGNVLVSNQGSNQVLQLLPNGRLVAFAGDGRSGSGGDGGRATAAQLDSPQGLAVGSHGITYVADTGNNRIQAISPAGVMSTLAEVSDPTAIAIGPDNILYTLDSSGLQTVGANGAVATLIPTTSARNGTPVNLLTIDGSSFAFFPSAIAVTSSGTLYLANSSPKELIEDSGGTFSLIGSSSVAEGVPYVTPNGLVASDNGDVFVANYGTFGVDRVVGASLTPVFAFGLHSVPGLEGFRPSGVAVGARGVLYVDTDGVNGGSNRAALVAIEPGDQVHLLAAGPITS